MTFSHAPAPWTAKAGDGYRSVYPADGHGKVATVHMRRSKTGNLSEMDAHAALICAAPALLAVCKAYLAGITCIAGADTREAHFLETIEDMAKAAVAQAEADRAPRAGKEG